MRTICLLLLAVGCAPLTAQQPAQAAPVQGAPVQASSVAAEPAPPPQIGTTATGESRATPDRAVIEIGVQTRAKTAAASASENAKRVQAVLDALRKLGLTAEQLSTVGYNVYPETSYDPRAGDQQPRITGYNVVNTVRAEVRQKDQVGQVIDAALGAGANVINSLSFFVSDPSAARREALQQAVQKARADAEALATAAGGRLGRLLELSTAESGYPQPIMYSKRGVMAEVAAAPTPIEPGQQHISATVTAVWEFIP